MVNKVVLHCATHLKLSWQVLSFHPCNPQHVGGQGIMSLLTVLADLPASHSDPDSFSSQHFQFWIQNCWLGVFVSLPGSGMDFSDFVPWSMGCNYIFTIGSPSYNVQRMLTICSNTSRYSRSWLLVTEWPDIYWYLPLQPWTMRHRPDLSPSERIFWQQPFLLWAELERRNEWWDGEKRGRADLGMGIWREQRESQE